MSDHGGRRAQRQVLKRWLADELGTAAIEYGLLTGVLAVALVAVLLATGHGLRGTMEKVAPSGVKRIEVQT